MAIHFGGRSVGHTCRAQGQAVANNAVLRELLAATRTGTLNSTSGSKYIEWIFTHTLAGFSGSIMQTRPAPTYFGGIIIPAASVATEVLGNWFQVQPWWEKLPWSVGLWASGAFLAGLLVQDLYNRDSWLRRWWSDRNRLVDHQECWHDEVGTGPGKLREGYSVLKFVRDVRSLEVRFWGLLPNAPEPHLLKHTEGQHHPRGATVRFPVARVPVFATDVHSTLGDKFQVEPGQLKKVVLDLRDGWRRQRISIDVVIRPPNARGTIELITEDRYRWAEL